MKKILKLIARFSTLFYCLLGTKEIMAQTSIYDLSFVNIRGQNVSMSTFKGKKILIVNTASECGYTKQYAQLQTLYEKYQNKLIIIGFPCNQFANQEPGNAGEIEAFCTKYYKIGFVLADKVSVKGKEAAPIYRWLTSKKLNGVLNAKITWNFNKFLIDENGKLLEYFPSNVNPLDEKIIRYLE